MIVISDACPTELPLELGTPEDFKIAEHAAIFIPDGATLQTRIGAVPNSSMVTINSALEVDPQGHIIADALGARQYLGGRRPYGFRRWH